MTKRLLTIVLITIFGCTNNENKEDILKPKWEVGDYRLFNEKGSYFVKTKKDTITNSTFEKTIKLTVLEKNPEDYVLEVEIQPTKDFSFSSSVDSIEIKINNTFDFLKDLTKYNIPYQIRVSNLGELTEIVNFDSYYEKFIGQVFKLKDTIKIDEQNKQTLKLLTGSNSPLKQRLEETLWKEVAEYFDIYNTKNPADNDVTKDFSIPDQMTGEPIPSSLTFHSIAINGDIQEIEVTVKFAEKLSDILETDTLNRSPKNYYDKMDNRTKYSYNMRTSWIENFKSSVIAKTDSVELRLIRDVKVSK